MASRYRARSLPLDGGLRLPSLSSGELAIAATEAEENDGSRREPLSASGDNLAAAWVGVPGREPFGRPGDLGGGGTPSPEAASVRRNSTHRREND